MILQLPINLKPKTSAVPVETIYLDKGSRPVPTQAKVDLVLGPSLYWFREKVLPAKTAFAAKNLAPSVFDAIIPQGEYDYFVIKRPEHFWLFAYDEALIAETIKHAGLKIGNIRNIYFAQTECRGMEHPLQVGDRRVLADVDGAVIELPLGYVDDAEAGERYFQTHERSKYRVPVNLYRNTLLDRKEIITLTAVALVFALIYGVDYFRAKQQLAAVLEKQETLRDAYALPQTSFELKGLIGALEKRETQQTALREKAKALFDLPLGADSRIDTLTLSTQKVAVSIALSDEKEGSALKNRLSQFMKITSEKMQDKKLTIEGTYE